LLIFGKIFFLQFFILKKSFFIFAWKKRESFLCHFVHILLLVNFPSIVLFRNNTPSKQQGQHPDAQQLHQSIPRTTTITVDLEIDFFLCNYKQTIWKLFKKLNLNTALFTIGNIKKNPLSFTFFILIWVTECSNPFSRFTIPKL